jgi:5'(3')-deoxyribonucleotidase
MAKERFCEAEKAVKMTPELILKIERKIKPNNNFLVQLFLQHNFIRGLPVKAFDQSIVNFKFNQSYRFITNISQI